jgi:hypothetical protein
MKMGRKLTENRLRRWDKRQKKGRKGVGKGQEGVFELNKRLGKQ